MDQTHSDALVFFGATGDLAYKKYVEEAWKIVDPYLKSNSPVHAYDLKTWGPAEAEKLVSEAGGWHNPVTTRR